MRITADIAVPEDACDARAREMGARYGAAIGIGTRGF